MLTRFAQTTIGAVTTAYGISSDTAWVIESTSPHTVPLIEAHIERLVESNASFAVLTGSLRSVINPATDGVAIVATTTDEEAVKYLVIGNSALSINGDLHTVEPSRAYAAGAYTTHGYGTEIALLTSAIKTCYTPSEPFEDSLKKLTHNTTATRQVKDTGYSILVLQI